MSNYSLAELGDINNALWGTGFVKGVYSGAQNAVRGGFTRAAGQTTNVRNAVTEAVGTPQRKASEAASGAGTAAGKAFRDELQVGGNKLVRNMSLAGVGIGGAAFAGTAAGVGWRAGHTRKKQRAPGRGRPPLGR